MNSRKKGAQESGGAVIVLVLVLAIAGIVLWFTYSFFGTGARLIDGNDPSIQVAIQSCLLEIRNNENAYCQAPKLINIRRGGEMIVSCYYLDTAVQRNSLEEVRENQRCLNDNQQFKENQCNLLKDSGVSDREWKATIVDGNKCDDILRGISITRETQIELAQGETERVYVEKNDQNHQIKFLERNIEKQTAKIEVRSSPIIVELKVGEEIKLDLNSDGNYDLYMKLESLSQIGVDLVVQEIDEKILKSEGDGEVKLLSYEECVSDLEQRKRDLGIPDRLCYWEAMTDLYDEKCENLNRQQISEIFERKEEYRQLNNPDWPSLNTDGDFCVDVIYDCDQWLNRRGQIDGSTSGFIPSEDQSVLFINPFLLGKDFSFTILHEGLHGIQDLSFRSTIIFPKTFLESYPEYELIPKKMEEIRQDLWKNYHEAFKKAEKQHLQARTDYINSMTLSMEFNSEDFTKLNEKLQEDIREIEKKSIERILLHNLRFVSIILIDFSQIDSDNYFYGLLGEGSEFNKRISDLRELTETESFWDYFTDHSNFHYLGLLLELDPRLSEIHRYWLDQTSPNCEILYTPEEFGEVLQQFLTDPNLLEEYKMTQRQLNDVMEIAEKMDRKQEIWEKLIGRGPGLASTTQPSEDYMYA